MGKDIVDRLKREIQVMSLVGCSCCDGLHNKECKKYKRLQLLNEAVKEIKELRILSNEPEGGWAGTGN